MLPKINRLKKQKDFERVFKKGKSIKEDFLILKIVKNNLKESRFGFVVSKKVAKKATLRNKIKRTLRMETKKKLSKIKPGLDIVLIANHNLKNKNFLEITEIINKIFDKAEILKSES